MFMQENGHHLFTAWGVKVSASLWYGILMGFIIVLWPMMGTMTIAEGVIVALGVTFSFLAHDFGHAFVAKRNNLKPSIMLQALGGFCQTEREPNSDGDEIKLVFAGPIVSMVLAGMAALLYVVAPAVVAASPVTQTLFSTLLWFNVGWALFNLLFPIWPYDGGRLLHLFLRRFQSEKVARKWALRASIVTVIPVGIVGFLQFGSLLVAFLVFYVVMHNMEALKSNTPLIQRKSSRSKNKASSFHEELLEEAEEAMQQEDWREAARLAHHMRSVGSMPSKMLARVWTILGIATMKMGKYDEALSYLKRAPEKAKVKRAIERCQQEGQKPARG